MTDGKKLRNWLRDEKISITDAASMAKLSRQTLTRYLEQAQLTNQQKEILEAGLSLPENFFEGPTQIAGDHATQSQTFSGIAECEKDLAVAEERIRQLEARLAEKDDYIKLLKSQLKK